MFRPVSTSLGNLIELPVTDRPASVAVWPIAPSSAIAPPLRIRICAPSIAPVKVTAPDPVAIVVAAPRLAAPVTPNDALVVR